MAHTISYRRPETPYSLSKMGVPTGVDVEAQIVRLKSLGYKIVEVSPPIGERPQEPTAV